MDLSIPSLVIVRRSFLFEALTASVACLICLGILSEWGYRVTQKAGERAPTVVLRTGSPALQLAALSGFNRVGANIYWIRSYRAWERQDAAEALRHAAWASWMNPEEWYFWQGTVQMIAYDFPRWEFVAGGYQMETDAAVWHQIREQYGDEALHWLEVAKRALPSDPRVELAAAHICLNVLADAPRARTHFRSAWEMSSEERPWFAARIYGELLRAEGDTKGALEWYRHIQPQLPSGLPAAERALFEQQIQKLAALSQESE